MQKGVEHIYTARRWHARICQRTLAEHDAGLAPGRVSRRALLGSAVWTARGDFAAAESDACLAARRLADAIGRTGGACGRGERAPDAMSWLAHRARRGLRGCGTRQKRKCVYTDLLFLLSPKGFAVERCQGMKVRPGTACEWRPEDFRSPRVGEPHPHT